MEKELTPEERKKTVSTMLELAQYEIQDLENTEKKNEPPKVLTTENPEDEKKIQDIFSVFKK